MDIILYLCAISVSIYFEVFTSHKCKIASKYKVSQLRGQVERAPVSETPASLLIGGTDSEVFFSKNMFQFH